jgi:hypothetical protein
VSTSRAATVHSTDCKFRSQILHLCFADPLIVCSKHLTHPHTHYTSLESAITNLQMVCCDTTTITNSLAITLVPMTGAKNSQMTWTCLFVGTVHRVASRKGSRLTHPVRASPSTCTETAGCAQLVPRVRFIANSISTSKPITTTCYVWLRNGCRCR